MNSLQSKKNPQDDSPTNVIKSTQPKFGHSAEAIDRAFLVAMDKQLKSVKLQVICGQALLEQREAVLNDGQSPTGERRSKFSRSKPDAENFSLWLRNNCPEVSHRLAYRYMTCAQKVISALLGSFTASVHTHIVFDEKKLFISETLSMPAEQASPEIKQFQAAFSKILYGHSMRDIIHRNSLNMEATMGDALEEISNALKDWGEMEPSDKEGFFAMANAFLAGGDILCHTPGSEVPKYISFKEAPLELIQFWANACDDILETQRREKNNKAA